ncbi:MAG TPA: hypothetical protein VK474_02690 [Chthoniobacterales bacterium]|nr:hypothetical protein [Chthoniobacterales bacterium]
MDDEPQEDWLDARLREEAPYLDDAGFTARVVHQLPARQQSRSLRSSILFAITFVACAAAFFLSGRGGFLGESAVFLVAMPIWTIAVLAGFCGLLVTTLGTVAAMTKARERRL